MLAIREALGLLVAEAVIVAVFLFSLYVGKLALWAWPMLIIHVVVHVEDVWRGWRAQRTELAYDLEFELADWEDELFTVARAGHLFSED